MERGEKREKALNNVLNDATFESVEYFANNSLALYNLCEAGSSQEESDLWTKCMSPF